MNDYEKRGVQVLGISFDSVESNAKFAQKYNFNFPLLCDTERRAGLLYGACDSKEAGYAKRITYIIDVAGKVTHAFPKVDPRIHVEEILKAIG
ncbi:MAG: peroxiredoxin [Nitrospirae bacterium]|nr:peroxiredoxin [Nitrospirota bacterium]